MLGILGLAAYATNSLHYFEKDALLTWAIATPILQWTAMAAGRAVLRRRAASPESRKSAVIVGAGPLGAKVARALQENKEDGRDFVGWFDDRTDERVHEETGTRVLGMLKDVAPYIRENGIKEVYITLPLGSQPRILELLESVQGTTASIFFVPDVFGISIIQGRLQDMNGVPVVGICETPFTGTNELVKRISDVVLASIIVVLISPLLLAIALGVKLSSPGPVIFRQRRNGLDGGEIMVYKFRSMTAQDNGSVVDAGDQGRPAHHAVRRLPAPDLARRVAAVLQRAARQHEHRRPAAACRRPQRAVPRTDQGLHGAPQGQARDHGVGAGQRPAWRNRDGREDEGPGRIRSGVPAQLVARPGPANHCPHHQGAVLRSQCLLN